MNMRDEIEKITQIAVTTHEHPDYEPNDCILVSTSFNRLLYGKWDKGLVEFEDITPELVDKEPSYWARQHGAETKRMFKTTEKTKP